MFQPRIILSLCNFSWRSWVKQWSRGKKCCILLVLKGSVCFYVQPPAIPRSPKSTRHDCQRQINEAGKCIRDNTAFWTIFPDGARVEACRMAVSIEFAFAHLGVMTIMSSWLAQIRRGVLIGQHWCWLMTIKHRRVVSSSVQGHVAASCCNTLVNNLLKPCFL